MSFQGKKRQSGKNRSAFDILINDDRDDLSFVASDSNEEKFVSDNHKSRRSKSRPTDSSTEELISFMEGHTQFAMGKLRDPNLESYYWSEVLGRFNQYAKVAKTLEQLKTTWSRWIKRSLAEIQKNGEDNVSDNYKRIYKIVQASKNQFCAEDKKKVFSNYTENKASNPNFKPNISEILKGNKTPRNFPKPCHSEEEDEMPMDFTPKKKFNSRPVVRDRGFNRRSDAEEIIGYIDLSCDSPLKKKSKSNVISSPRATRKASVQLAKQQLDAMKLMKVKIGNGFIDMQLRLFELMKEFNLNDDPDLDSDFSGSKVDEVKYSELDVDVQQFQEDLPLLLDDDEFPPLNLDDEA